VDYTSAIEKLNQLWRYKTLAVIKRHKNHLSFNAFVASRAYLEIHEIVLLSELKTCGHEVLVFHNCTATGKMSVVRIYAVFIFTKQTFSV